MTATGAERWAYLHVGCQLPSSLYELLVRCSPEQSSSTGDVSTPFAHSTRTKAHVALRLFGYSPPHALPILRMPLLTISTP